MFGTDPKLPVDLLLGGHDDTDVIEGGPEEWILKTIPARDMLGKKQGSISRRQLNS